MQQIDEHLKWCLKDHKRLIKTKPDIALAQKHLKKSEYNYSVMQTLERLKRTLHNSIFQVQSSEETLK